MTRLSLIATVALASSLAACSVFRYGESTVRFEKRSSAHVSTRTVTSNDGDEVTLVRAAVNGEELGWFMLVSGSSYCVIDVKHAPRIPKLSKQSETEIPYPCKIPVTVYQAKTLSVGALTINNLDLISFDLSAVFQNVEEDIVGMLGYPLFAHSVVKIEYGGDGDDRVSVFPPDSFELTGGNWQPLSTVNFQPAVPGRVNRTHSAPFVIDTGYSGNVSFYSVFAANRDVLEGRPTSEKPSFTVCGETTELEGVVRAFDFGGNSYNELTVSILQPGSIADVAPGRMGGVIGRGLLCEYTVVFDVENQRIAFLKTVTN